MVARFSLVYEELGRVLDAVRAENAALEARLVPEIERLRDEVRRIQRENAAIVRLVAGPREARAAVNELIEERDAATPVSVNPMLVVRPDAPAGPGASRHGLFAELERGSREEIAARVEGYLPFFERGPIVDLGCGRGEFLEVVAARGLPAYGVDSDPEAVAVCRSLGLDARQEDLFDHLRSLDDGALGGVFCSQVVEHLPPELLPDLMVEIARVLESNGTAVVETPNPASFATHVHSFWRDPTHLRPVPDVALAFAARTAGLVVETTVYSSLPPAEDRLQSVGVRPSDPDLRALVEEFNAMTERLNDLLYGYQDYALVLRKPS
jgi:SAM-dependent methyltransferase